MRAIGIRLAATAALFAGSFLALGQVWDLGAGQVMQQTSEQPLAVAASQVPTSASTTQPPTTQAPTTQPPTTQIPTTVPPTTTAPTTTAPPTTSPATTQLPETTSAPVLDHQLRGEAALAKITYPWQSRLSGWTIEFRPSRSGVLGYTYTSEERIEVYVRDSMSDELLAHVVAHEIGHAVDVALNNGDDRRSWLSARGIPNSVWWPEEGGVSDFSSGAGDFAEGFAAWQIGTGSYRSKLGPAPNSAQLELIAQLANN